ncbi:UDP-N-acetylglucosamine 2-epimerase (non-hydrolyzing) [Thiospirochaeta perfilievii]|uniref:UDP-N-acetylglucosamine 2-epimerase (Non-hydrolyzing) n=1 Tax=Thiospirochaeta perfilievii TaxID=252967 RepID=A0A5C1QDL4_9SPIO|nr:UDP-N-acetylglucosamine 2-epimerase (non-hydrolyzing) [Thiospirochaeta perfilievii]QEN05671.1 UDP-N-acetylglucosamine 2-epimerase (non-hydrolyzing) [Thiospirochaeta perfilievii]
MRKIVSIVGARPQFVKAAVISRLIKDKYSDKITEYLVHTGQHYDQNMSDIFFQEMRIPKPDLNLAVGSGSHGKMTGEMLAKIEEVLLEQKPDALLIYGDTNSTLAGALAASKLHIPVCHVEAGLRSYNKLMPEEQNRIVADHLSELLLCPTQTAIDNLVKEGITKGVSLTGDVMFDASIFYRTLENTNSKLVNIPENFFLATIHRAENTDSKERLTAIVNALNDCGKNGVLPLHPRTKKYLDDYGLTFNKNISLIDPIGYFDMLELEANADFIVTDSGGVQKEAYFFNKPCITLRDQTEWVETVDAGWNVIVGADYNKIVSTIKDFTPPVEHPELYGDGNSGTKIVEELLKLWNSAI